MVCDFRASNVAHFVRTDNNINTVCTALCIFKQIKTNLFRQLIGFKEGLGLLAPLHGIERVTFIHGSRKPRRAASITQI